MKKANIHRDIYWKFTLLFLLVFNVTSFSQTPDTSNIQWDSKFESITIRGKVKPDQFTKGGLMMKGYVIEADREEIEKFKGKRIKVTGKFHIMKDLAKRPKEYDQNGDEIVYQGWYGGDTKHISSPKIKVIWFW